MDNFKFYEPLIEAVKKGDLEKVLTIIEVGINVDLEDLDGIPLGVAARNGNLELVQVLLKAGANVNYLPRNSDNMTALMEAARGGSLDIVKILVEAGANVNEEIQSGSALEMAAMKGEEEIYNYLAPLSNPELIEIAKEDLYWGIRNRQREKTADPLVNVLSDATFCNDIDTVRQILAQGVELNSFDSDGSTPLRSAILGLYPNMVKILLEAGANPSLSNDENSHTPLIDATRRSPKAYLICSLLIAAGADINATTDEGKTALIGAAYFGSLEIVQMLLKAGADVNIKDNEGKTALDYAIIAKNQEIIQLLQEAGASED